jgi:hypothetical protein
MRQVQIHKGNPTLADVHTNRALTDVSEAYYVDESMFLGSSAFPLVPVDKQSNFFYKWPAGEFFRDAARVRAPGTEVIRDGATPSTTSYQCLTYEFGDDIPYEVEAEQDNPLNIRRTKTRRIMQVLLIRRERIFATNFMGTSKWTTDITGASTASTNQVIQWDRSGSTPIDDIEDAKELIHTRSYGACPANTLVLGYQTKKKLKTNAQILDRLKYGQTPGGIAMITDSDLAQVFGVDRILTAGAVYNSANKGATATPAFVTGKVALLCHSAPNPGIDVPSAGMCFVNRNQFAGANGLGALIQEMDIPEKRKINIDGFINFDMKLTAPDLGVFFTTIVQ